MLLAYLRDVPLSTLTARVLALAGLMWYLVPWPCLPGPLASFWTTLALFNWGLALAIITVQRIGEALEG